MSCVATFVPACGDDSVRTGCVVICFDVVRRVVARVSQQRGKATYGFRNGKGRSHLVCSQIRCENPSDQARSRWRANRSGRERSRVSDALCCQFINVRCPGVFVSVATQRWAHVFCRNPKDVRTIILARPTFDSDREQYQHWKPEDNTPTNYSSGSRVHGKHLFRQLLFLQHALQRAIVAAMQI